MRKTYLMVAMLLALVAVVVYVSTKQKPSAPQTLGASESVTILPNAEPIQSMPPAEPATSMFPETSVSKIKTIPEPITLPEQSVASSEFDGLLADAEPLPEIPGDFASTPLSTERMDEAEYAQSPFSFDLLAGHAMGPDSGIRTFSEFLFEAQYHLSHKSHFGIGQDAKKLYEIAAVGENEFLLGDTHLYYDYELSPEFLGLKWNIETGVTLPVSKESIDSKNVTRASIALHIKKALLDNEVALSASPLFAYSFNRYATLNGVPLQKMVLGGQVEADWQIARGKLNLVAWGKGYYRMYEEFDFSRTSPAATTSFGLGTYLKYRITNNIAPQIGVNRGTSILPNVRYDSAFYDQEATRFYVALEITL